ncbi:MAG: hypothetical protein ACXVZL_03770 [Gaiellaceae bacterium]
MALNSPFALILAAVLVVAVGLLALLLLRRRGGAAVVAQPLEAPVDERPLAERTAPPPVEPGPPSPEAEPQPGPGSVPGLEEPAVVQPSVPEAVRDLPRAEELPEWFVRLRTGAPLESEKRPRRR